MVVQLSWRPIMVEDAVAWATLLAAAEAADGTGEHYSVEDLLEELADPHLDMVRDTVAAFDGDRMVAYGLVRAAGISRGVHRVHTEGCVHPQHRRTGLGREMLRRTAARAAQRHEACPDVHGELLTRCHDGNSGAAALLDASGFTPVRWFYDMHRDLAEPPPVAPLPGGLRLVGFDPSLDEALRGAHNEAFADHWGSPERSVTSWRQWFTGSRAFRPALSFALLDSEEVAGYLLSYEYEADCTVSGVREAWVGQLGTRRPWRGRGIASALLTHALRAYADAGYERTGLGVDSSNPTGALSLYERTGFVVNQRWTTYARPL
jgi:mycothiol synthase